MQDTLTLPLRSGSNAILKTGFVFRSVFILGFVVGAALMGLQTLHGSPVLAVICFAISFGLIIVMYRMLSAAFHKEEVQVTKSELIITQKNLNIETKQVIELRKIRSMGFADRHYTPHPLHNPVVDITGLATQEREMQYVIDDGNIVVETDDEVIRFGKQLPSWDVEEFVEQVETFTGMKFKRPAAQVNDTSEETAEQQEEEEMTAEVAEQDLTGTEHLYHCAEGQLTILQKLETPSAEDRAWLNGKPAPTGKYMLGENKYILVSNGLIYAVRGF